MSTLNRGSLRARTASILRRNDLTTEINEWINFVLREVTSRISFPEMRVTASKSLVVGTYKYDISADWSITNFGTIDKLYYKDTTVTPSWGRELIFIPRYAYKQLGFERLLNVTTPISGDPFGYTLDNDTIWFDIAPSKTATIVFTYYKINTDLSADATEPDIAEKWRHHLIPMICSWGQMWIEKDDLNKIMYWENKFETQIKKLRKLVMRSENQNMWIAAPSMGLEHGDKIY